MKNDFLTFFLLVMFGAGLVVTGAMLIIGSTGAFDR
jgi:hypothetical protein